MTENQKEELTREKINKRVKEIQQEIKDSEKEKVYHDIQIRKQQTKKVLEEVEYQYYNQKEYRGFDKWLEQKLAVEKG